MQISSAINVRSQQQQIATPSSVPSIGSPIPGILDFQPVLLDSQVQSQLTPNSFVSNTKSGPAQQAHQQSTFAKFFSVFGYLVVAVMFIMITLVTIIFIAASMRSSAGAAFKSLGNFSAFSGPHKAGHRRQDGGLASMHSNKDLLVINNQNGHQFLYAPASTKISSSSSTHILSAANPAAHQGTLHHMPQQLYSGNAGTLSNLSATGAQSNNYYYGLVGLNSLFQHQQQPHHHFSQHHLNQQQQNHLAQSAANYNHQANMSTVSTESANSSSSSSGVESGSTSIQQQQQSQNQQQACLVTMNNDYNLMGNHLSNYGQQHNLLNSCSTPSTAQHQQQATITLNAHYTSSGVPSINMSSNQHQLHTRQMSNATREHIYECVDDDRPYTARLLMSMGNEQQLQHQLGTLGHQVSQQQSMQSPRTMTLSSRLLQDALHQQQSNNQMANNVNGNNNKRLFPQTTIVRDSQGAKTNVICSKLAQVTPQRALEIGGKTFQQDVMAIYNGSDVKTTTNATTATNPNSCFGRLEMTNNNSLNMSKLSTDC